MSWDREIPVPLGHRECVCDVHGVVDGEADGEDHADAGDGVDGLSDEVRRASDIDLWWIVGIDVIL